ncbi:MAG: hypothetical protein KDE08_06225 [Rhodobacteraceae bacterium]|nr:hypothetical protein [Paracoccaceae bacterium]
MPVRSGAIHLHAGSSGPAASTVNGLLAANRGWFASQRVGVIDASANTLMAPAGNAAPDAETLRCTIVSAAALLCDPEALLRGRFFPDAHAQATCLRALLGRPVERLVISVEPYDSLFAGAWRRVALDRPVEPLERFVPRFASFEGGWLDCVEALRDGLDAVETLVATADLNPVETLAQLLPEGVTLGSLAQPSVPRVTDSAIAMVQHHRRLGVTYAPGQLDRLLSFHSQLPQIEDTCGFEGLALADMRGRYIADIDTLARWKGITLIGQYAAAMAAE